MLIALAISRCYRAGKRNEDSLTVRLMSAIN